MVRLGLQFDGAPLPSLSSVVRPVTVNGQPALLKVTNEPEELSGARALETWDGNGAVRVLARDGTAIVLERAGATLRSLVTEDTAATEALCAVRVSGISRTTILRSLCLRTRSPTSPWIGSERLPEAVACPTGRVPRPLSHRLHRARRVCARHRPSTGRLSGLRPRYPRGRHERWHQGLAMPIFSTHEFAVG